MEHCDVMNKKSSPRSRPSRKSPSRAVANIRRPQATQQRADTGQSARPATPRERLRRFLPVVLLPNIVLVLLIVVIAFGGLLFSGRNLAMLPAVIAESWFAFHLVTITIEGVTLGALPLLPPILIAAAVARRVGKAVRKQVSVLDLSALLVLTVVIPLTLSGIAWFMVWDAGKVFPVEPPNVVVALLHPVLIHLVGLIIGMGAKLWKALVRRWGIPAGAVDGVVRAKRIFVRVLLAAGAVYLVLLALGHERVGETVQNYPILTVPGAIALIAACVAYLPNAALGVFAALIGGNVTLGNANFNLFSVDPAPLPAFPLFAAVPDGTTRWVPLLLVIPVAIILVSVWRASWNLLVVVAAAVAAGVMAGAATYSAAGEIGAYGYSGPVAWLAGLLFFAWVGLIAGAVWATAQWRARREASSSEDSKEDNAEAEGAADAQAADTRSAKRYATHASPAARPEPKAQSSEEDQGDEVPGGRTTD